MRLLRGEWRMLRTKRRSSLFIFFVFFCFANAHATEEEGIINWLRVARVGGGIALCGASVGLEFLSQWLRKESGRFSEIEKKNIIKKQKKESDYSPWDYEPKKRSNADDYGIKSFLCAGLSKAACFAGAVLIWVGATGDDDEKGLSSPGSPQPNFLED